VTNFDLPPRPYSIAHRGASAYAADNSLTAFRKAAELGADMWEMDLRVTADGDVVVYHDATLPDGRALTSLSLEQIQSAIPDCPTFADVVKLASEHGAGIYADIKHPDACLPILEGLKLHGIERAILGAFNTDTVDILRRANCPYPISALIPLGADPHTYAPQSDIVHLCWEKLDRPQDALTPELFARAFADGQQVVLWHEEDPDRMAAVRDKPVTGICSDMPELVNPFRPPDDWPVEIVCHRGANKIAPENTLPALECSLAAGFSHVEVDLRISADDQILVIHDRTVDRTTNGTGAVSEQSFDALRQLDAGSWFDPHFVGTKLPTLEEVLSLLGKYEGKAYLELKSAPPALVWDQVTDSGMQDRCFFWSFDRDYLLELRAISDDAKIMARRQDYPDLQTALNDYSADLIEFLPNESADEVAELSGSATTSMLAYGGKDPAVFDRLMEMRPNLVNLDQPFAFRRHLERAGVP